MIFGQYMFGDDEFLLSSSPALVVIGGTVTVQPLIGGTVTIQAFTGTVDVG